MGFGEKRARRKRHLHWVLPATAILLLCAAACSAQSGTAPGDGRQMALALERSGRNVEAESAWNSYLSAHPSSSEAYAHLGLLEARQEQYKEAIPFYRKALALHSTIPVLQLNLGLAYFKVGEMEQALEEFTPLLNSMPQSSPNRQQLVILMGMCHYGLKHYAAAAPYLKEALDRDPQNLELLMTLAHSYLWSKQYLNVLETYRVILRIDPNSAEADMLAGEASDELKDVRGAIEQFRAAVKADPKTPDVHFGLGYLLWGRRNYAEAEPEFKAELDNNPNHAQALAYLGDVNMQLERPDAAILLLNKAIKIDPGIELAYIDLSAIYADAGRRDDSLRELKAALKLAPNDVNVHWRLARLYRAMGNQQEAMIEFNKAKGITQAADDALIYKLTPRSDSAPPPAVVR